MTSNPPETPEGATKFCWNCGTQIPMEAAFCWKCGKPQKEGVQPEEPKYETCEITLNNLGNSGWRTVFDFKFQADAMGPKGKYIVFHTPKYTSDINYVVNRNKYEGVVNGLVNKLVQGGWEPVETKGENWWNYRFRRKIFETVQAGESKNLQSIDITDENFDAQVLRAVLPVAVYFWASWDKNDTIMGPAIDQIAAEFAGKLIVAKMNVDANQHAARKQGVMGVPAVLIFKNGRRVDRIIGIRDLSGTLRQKIEKLLSTT